MEFALDNNNYRVRATEDLDKGDYRCPVCGGKMIIKNKGEYKVPHFAHDTNKCTDSWNYDMSEWHRKMQGYFSEKYREVVCEKNGAKHIADILKDGVVIEFQHSPISSQEFRDRNEFYSSLGYKVVWVFDVSDQYADGRLSYINRDDNKLMLRWKYPLKVLQGCPTLNDYSKDFALYLYCEDSDDESNINKVIWSSKNDDGCPNFERVLISPFEFCLEYNMDPNELFASKKDMLSDRLRKCPEYEKKVIGEKGHPRIEYVCPKNNVFGLHLSGETACSYCKYCAAIEKARKKDGGEKTNIYCCYPNQVNECGEKPYECYVPIF